MTTPLALRRVAYVCTDPGIPVFGTKGASVHAQAVLRALLRRGVEVHLLTSRAGGPAPAGLEAVRVHELPAVTGSGSAKGPDRLASRERSAVASDAAVAGVLDGLLADGPLDLVYERYALWGRTATAWARRTGVPSLLEVNAPLPDEQATHRGLLDVAGARAVAADALSAATASFGVSDAVTAWARGHAADPARVRTVANGVDTRAVMPAERPVTGPDDLFTVGFVGTLKAWHGVETLVDATARLVAQDPSYRLLLVGDGPRADALRARAADLGISAHVETTGALPAADVPAQLHRMDVACAPYPALDDFYFSPLKVTEYLAAGLPVVASAVGGLPALLGHGAHGTLVAPDDPAALAAAVATLRADVVRRRSLRTANRAAALAADWDHVLTASLAHLDAARGVSRAA